MIEKLKSKESIFGCGIIFILLGIFVILGGILGFFIEGQKISIIIGVVIISIGIVVDIWAWKNNI